MKKVLLLASSLLIIGMLAGCGEKDTQLEDYKNNMEDFFSAMENYDSEINEIDPTDSEALTELFDIFDKMEKSYKELADMEVPDDFSANKTLAVQASDYMTQANDYFHQSFTDTSYNEYTLEAAMECYKRANKRLGYMITILHGEIPEDENVTYE